MRLIRLQLFDYRNFRRLDLSPGAGANLFLGDNAQGKTNLLEAVYFLATMKALRAETEVQVIRRDALQDDPLPAARVVGEAETSGGEIKLEVAVVARQGASAGVATKTVKVNGIPKRLADAVGRLTAVLFTAGDIELVTGSPASRRRYLDITLSQVDRAYLTARSRFERVLSQRNHLLKRIREGHGATDELAFWDDELVRDGATLFAARAAALRELSGLAAAAHADLAPGEALALEYQPRVDATAGSLEDTASAAETYAAALKRGLSRDAAAGMTLQGPHRDDIAFTLDDAPAAGFASRAQQRTIALALRLAEARLLHGRRGEPPVLLLDDILSEMDAGRARTVMESISTYDQLLVTATDTARFPAPFLASAAVFSVVVGAVTPESEAVAANPGPGTAES